MKNRKPDDRGWGGDGSPSVGAFAFTLTTRRRVKVSHQREESPCQRRAVHTWQLGGHLGPPPTTKKRWVLESATGRTCKLCPRPWSRLVHGLAQVMTTMD